MEFAPVHIRRDQEGTCTEPSGVCLQPEWHPEEPSSRVDVRTCGRAALVFVSLLLLQPVVYALVHCT